MEPKKLLHLPDNGNYRTVQMISKDTIRVVIFENCLYYSFARSHKINPELYSKDVEPGELDELQSLMDAMDHNEYMEASVVIERMAIKEIHKTISRFRPECVMVSIETLSDSHEFFFDGDRESNKADDFMQQLISWKFNLNYGALCEI